MSSKVDLYSSSIKDTGCPKLQQILGHPVKCLACPLDKCLYDMSAEAVYALEDKLSPSCGEPICWEELDPSGIYQPVGELTSVKL